MSVTDIDGNVYKTIKIGNQEWMSENLSVTHYRNGDAIPHIRERDVWEMMQRGGYCNYNKGNLSGMLYNWLAVSDIRHLAPEGWHVPTDKEWKILETYLGGRKLTGKKLMVSSLEHWNNPNKEANSESGFNAEPVGWRGSQGSHMMMGENAAFWTASSLLFESWYRNIITGGSSITRLRCNKRFGLSVRCIRDD